MNTLICPTRFKTLPALLLLALLLAACGTRTPPQTIPPQKNHTQPAQAGNTPVDQTEKPAANLESTPSVIIKGKSAAAILDNVVKFRTSKGMKISQRDAKFVQFSMHIPNSSPPANVLMIYSISPATDGLRLSAQVFQIIKQKGKSLTGDITAGLKDKLQDELEGYAR